MSTSQTPVTTNFEIKPATPADVPIIFELVQALAKYEQLSHEVTGTPDLLHQYLFGDRAYAEARLAWVEGNAAGFILFFHNFSTFLMRPGIYLEDLFVLPEFRRRGIGRALLRHLGQLAVERGCGRLEWNVLDWNAPAIEFYQQMGAELKQDWRLCRVAGSALDGLSQRT